MDLVVITDVLSATLRIATPLILMGLGGLLCERAGVFNIALEGFALMGAFMAIVFVQYSGGSVWLGMFGAILSGIIFSSIFALFVTRFKADAIITSIAINMLSAGLTTFLLRTMFDVQGSFRPDVINKLRPITIPLIDKIPILGSFSGHNVVTYLALALMVVIFVILFKTKMGLNICAVGESEDAARTAGVSPMKIKWIVILTSGALSALAGAFLSTNIVSQFSEHMLQGRGFTAYTAVIFGAAHPILVGLAAMLFGFADAVGIRLELLSTGISPSLIKMFPFLLAIFALALSAYSAKRKLNSKIKDKA